MPIACVELGMEQDATRKRISRIKRQQRFAFGDGFIEAFKMRKRVGAIVQKMRIIRADTLRAVEAVKRVFVPAKRQQRISAIEHRLDMVRLQRQHALETEN